MTLHEVDYKLVDCYVFPRKVQIPLLITLKNELMYVISHFFLIALTCLWLPVAYNLQSHFLSMDSYPNLFSQASKSPQLHLSTLQSIPAYLGLARHILYVYIYISIALAVQFLLYCLMLYSLLYLQSRSRISGFCLGLGP